METYGWTIKEYENQPIGPVLETVTVLNAIASKKKQELQRQKRKAKRGRRRRKR